MVSMHYLLNGIAVPPVKPACEIEKLDYQYQSHIEPSSPGQYLSSEPPVQCPTPRHISRADHHVVLLGQPQHLDQVLWLMAPVRVHFNHELIAPRKSPGEPMDIGSRQPQLAGSLLKKETHVCGCRHYLANRVSRAIGTAIVHNQYMKPGIHTQDCLDQSRQIACSLKVGRMTKVLETCLIR